MIQKLLHISCFLWIVLFTSQSVDAQTVSAVKIGPDSLDRYGVFGIRPGMFLNLKKENRFASATCGVFLDYNFGKFRHSIELDFLTKSFRKFFRNAYSPCFAYHFSVKKQLRGKMELHPGIFINCRRDMPNRRESFNFNDTAYLKTGQHTIFSIGPSIEISRRVFFSEKNGFLVFGLRAAYSFDILGFGNIYEGPNTSGDRQGWIASSKRFQKDALVFTLKIGWGKFVRPERVPPKVDFELGM